MRAARQAQGCIALTDLSPCHGSPEEDKALENALASQWDRPDRSAGILGNLSSKVLVNGTAAETSGFPALRLEKVATFLPKKDLSAVKRRFALLQVTASM